RTPTPCPSTTTCRSAAATRLGVWMLNVHASGGHTMMKAARDAAEAEAARLGQRRPLVIAVTMLTSLSDETMGEIGVAGALAGQVDRKSTRLNSSHVK